MAVVLAVPKKYFDAVVLEVALTTDTDHFLELSWKTLSIQGIVSEATNVVRMKPIFNICTTFQG